MNAVHESRAAALRGDKVSVYDLLSQLTRAMTGRQVKSNELQ